MIEYTASNGIVIRRRADGVLALGDGFLFNAGHEAAWREFFQHERDEELGRWRSANNKGFAVYPVSTDRVRVLRESDGISFTWNRKDAAKTMADDEHGGAVEAAHAYFEAHPERKPWEDAEEGQVWIVTPSKALTLGEEVEYPAIFQAGRFRDHGGSWDARDLKKARRIWPGGDAS